MKKDFTNVLITFSLIASMVVGGSFFYGKKVSYELAAEKMVEEKMLHEQEVALLQAEEQEKTAQKIEEERIAKEAELEQEKIKPVQTGLNAQQAELDRSNAAKAAALAQQQADADIAAQKAADQRAADALAKKKASRKSRVS